MCYSFVTFVGISYQIPGSVAGERALLITEHMKVMGLLDSARILFVLIIACLHSLTGFQLMACWYLPDLSACLDCRFTHMEVPRLYGDPRRNHRHPTRPTWSRPSQLVLLRRGAVWKISPISSCCDNLHRHRIGDRSACRGWQSHRTFGLLFRTFPSYVLYLCT